ncbi:MAG: GntR family transcriptional regulator, partial [Deltaproteobacteria bacterium]|nr:GntR family transcriptional regulator [Deltaproteobacteria bacterium]
TLKWTVDFSSGVHVYKQIINTIYSAIGNGELAEGDKLPTIKELAERLEVNPNTIAKSYRELELKGVIASKRGNGSFISVNQSKAVTLTDKEKESRLNNLFSRVIAEAKNEGITEDELMDYIINRRR